MTLAASIPPSYLSKTSVPAAHGPFIRRERLLRRLEDSTSRRLTVLCAPAGFGKTTLLSQFAAETPRPSFWLTVDRWDRDPSDFLVDLTYALRQQKQVLQTVVDAQHPEGRRYALHAIIDAAAASNPAGLLLVFDDYQAIDGQDPVVELVEELIRSAPACWDLVIASRNLPTSAVVSRLVGLSQGLSIGAEELAFDEEEVHHYMLDVRGVEFSATAARDLLDRTEGWPASIVLCEPDGREGQKSRIEARGRLLLAGLLEEAFQRQETGSQTFLLESSVLTEMNPDVCDHVLGRRDSLSLLSSVESSGFFLSRVGADRPVFRYHQLFRDFLLEKLKRERPSRFNLLCLKAGRLYKSRRDWNEAISQFAQAGRWHEVATVIRSSAETLLSEGRGLVVSQWLELMPAEMLESEPDLQLLLARVRLDEGLLDDGLAILDRVSTMSGASEHLRAVALVHGSLGLSRKGRHREAVRSARRATSVFRRLEAPARDRAEAFLRLGVALGSSGDFRKAEGPLKQALALADSIGDTTIVATAADSLAHGISSLGRVPEAQSHFETARRAWTSLRNDYRLALTLNNLGVLYYWQGEYELSLKVLSEALANAQVSGNTRLQAFAMLSLGDVKRDQGRHSEALELYNDALEMVRALGEPYFVDYGVDALGTTYMLMGDLRKAEILIQGALADARQRGGSFELGLFQCSSGILSYLKGEIQQAVFILAEAAGNLHRAGAKREQAKALFHLANAQLAANRRRMAVDSLQQVARLAGEMGYSGFLRLEARRCPTLAAFAVSKGVGNGLFMSIRELEADSASSSGGRRLVAVGSHHPKLEAFALGPTVLKLDGKTLRESEWSSVRSKEMLLYFLTQSAPVSRNECACALWPEFDEDRARNNFHLTLYKLRSATYFDLICNDGGQYFLNPEASFWFDVDEFKRRIQRADQHVRGSEARANALASALKVYRGPFGLEFYSEWVETLRSALEQTHMRALASLAGYHYAQGAFDASVRLCEEIISLDECNDEAHCLKIDNLLSLGERVAAHRHLESYRRFLADNIGVEPSTRLLEVERRVSLAAS